MKCRRIVALGLLCILVMVIMTCFHVNSAYGTVNLNNMANPRYAHTESVFARLSIDESGCATCSGDITVYDKGSMISMTVQLLKKNGSSWYLVASWSGSESGNISYSIKHEHTVTPGTYKVSVSGIITTTDDQSESVSISTKEKYYRKRFASVTLISSYIV